MATAYTPWLYTREGDFESREKIKFSDGGEDTLWVCREGVTDHWEIPKNTKRIRFFVTSNPNDGEHCISIKRQRIYGYPDNELPPFAFIVYDDKTGYWAIRECWDFVQALAAKVNEHFTFKRGVLALGLEYDTSAGSGK